LGILVLVVAVVVVVVEAAANYKIGDLCLKSH